MRTGEPGSRGLGRGECVWEWMRAIPGSDGPTNVYMNFSSSLQQRNSTQDWKLIGGSHLTAQDVRDAHVMVIDHVGKVVGGSAIGLDEDHVVLGVVEEGELAVDQVVEGDGCVRVLSCSNEPSIISAKVE